MPSRADVSADLRLDGKVALVTGAAGGLGRAIARRLHDLGAVAIVADLNGESASALVSELGEPATAVAHDAGSESSWGALAVLVRERFGRLDVLVNNAAVYRPHPIPEESVENYRKVFEVNQLGPFLGIRTATELMGENGGSIVNISSTGGLRGYEGTLAYASTKWALRGMTKVAARELAVRAIRVNSVHPGLCETPMAYENTPELLESLRRGIPLGRLGEPDEVAALVGFLASDASRYMSGAEIAIDGAATV